MRAPQLAGLAVLVMAAPASAGEIAPGPSDAIVNSIEDPALRDFLSEVLERNPEIAALEARMAAAGHRSISVRKLPDPRAEVTAYVLPPETRVGPQRFAARLTQQLPGGGKRDKSSRAAAYERQTLEAEIQALRLELVSDARRLLREIAYLDEARQVLVDDHATLAHYEELARARYASGGGLQMDAVQIQAEMTRLEARRSEIDERRAADVAELNRLRDRAGVPVSTVSSTPPSSSNLDWETLAELALASRPELAADTARIERAEVMIELAADDRSPDFSVGLTYAYVDRRTDVDVPDNGQDVLGISGGISIPIWKTATNAEVEAGAQDRLVREAARRSTVSVIQRELEDLRGRIPEIARRLALFDEVLPIQSEQALASAEAAYIAGSVDALALLEAERVLLDVRLSAARSRADLAIALIDLEGAIAAPIPRGGRS